MVWDTEWNSNLHHRVPRGTCVLLFSVGEIVVDCLFNIPRPHQEGPREETIPLSEFIVGPENALIGYVGRTYDPRSDRQLAWNPLVLYGNSGNGKSEFLKHLVRRWTSLSDRKETMFVEASRLANRFSVQRLTSIINQFRKQLESAEFLAIDDLDALSHRPKLQEFLAQCIDEFIGLNRPVVVTSSVIPHSGHLVPRLASRLQRGLTVSISEPGRSTRHYVIRKLAEAYGLNWSNQKVSQVVSRVNGSIPRINEAIHAYSSSQIENVDTVRQSNKKESNEILTEITKSVSLHFHIPAKQLKGRSRRQSTVHARCLAVYIAREFAHLAYARIGDFYGQRDHSTIMNAHRKASMLIHQDSSLCQFVMRFADQW